MCAAPHPRLGAAEDVRLTSSSSELQQTRAWHSVSSTGRTISGGAAPQNYMNGRTPCDRSSGPYVASDGTWWRGGWWMTGADDVDGK